MTRYVPSRQYQRAGIAAILFGLFSVWCGTRWVPAYLAAGLFLLSAAILIYLARRPSIEIYESHLRIGTRDIPWTDVRRVDRSGPPSVLIVNLGLLDETHILLIYPGDIDSANSLLRQLRRCSREALIDGKPYREFWGSNLPSEGRAMPSPHYRLLLPEDEAEVERLYQRLKTVRHLDPDNSGDEK